MLSATPYSIPYRWNAFHFDFSQAGKGFPARHFPDGVDDAQLVFHGQIAGAGKTDAAAEQVLGNRSPEVLVPGIQRLQMHRFPDRPRLHSHGVQAADERISRTAE